MSVCLSVCLSVVSISASVCVLHSINITFDIFFEEAAIPEGISRVTTGYEVLRIKILELAQLVTYSGGRAKAQRPARTYIQQLCADTGCSLKDLLEAMDDREGWWERVREICTGGVI